MLSLNNIVDSENKTIDTKNVKNITINDENIKHPNIDNKGICRCPECETYFNKDVQRPIINISEEDYKFANDIISLLKISARLKSYCPKHVSGPIICKFEYWEWHGRNDQSIEVSYKFKKCQLKHYVVIHMDADVDALKVSTSLPYDDSEGSDNDDWSLNFGARGTCNNK